MKIGILSIWLPFSNPKINAGSLLPKCLMRANGKMINTLTMMMTFPLKNQSLGRQVNIVLSCLTKKTIRETLIGNSSADKLLSAARRDEPICQL